MNKMQGPPAESALSPWSRIGALRWFLFAVIPLAVWLLRGVLGQGLYLVLFIGSVYAVTIAGASSLILPPFARRMPHLGVWKFWPVYLSLVAVSTILGVAVATAVFWAVEVFPENYFWQQTESNTVLAVFISYAMSIVFLYQGRAQQRLAEAEARLTEQQMAAEQSQKMLAQSELNNLKSQLHPHFLFNSLNSVAALIPEDSTRAEEMLLRICDVLRISLDTHSQQMVTLGRELELLQAYAAIQKVRFGDRLVLRIDASDDVSNALVPAFSLQPLVENSVKYVASSRQGVTRIGVSIEAQGDRLLLEVGDNGDGFEESSLREGHSLANLRARLRNVFGSSGRVLLSRTEDGMRVRLEFPFTIAGSSDRGEAVAS